MIIHYNSQLVSLWRNPNLSKSVCLNPWPFHNQLFSMTYAYRLIFSGIPCFECSEVLACAMKPGQPPNFNSFKGSVMVLTIFGFWSVLSFQRTEWNHRNRLDCSLPYEFPLSLLGDGFQEVYLLESSNPWVVSKTELSSGSAHFVTFVSFSNFSLWTCYHWCSGTTTRRKSLWSKSKGGGAGGKVVQRQLSAQNSHVCLNLRHQITMENIPQIPNMFSYLVFTCSLTSAFEPSYFDISSRSSFPREPQMQHDAASFGHSRSASWDIPYALTFSYFMTPFQFPLKNHGAFALTSSNFFSVAFFCRSPCRALGAWWYFVHVYGRDTLCIMLDGFSSSVWEHAPPTL